MPTVQGLPPVNYTPHPEATSRPAGGPDFQQTLRSVFDTALVTDAQATSRIESFATGSPGALHETAIAASKAEIAFRLLMSVRNRLLESYREVMRMGM